MTPRPLVCPYPGIVVLAALGLGACGGDAGSGAGPGWAATSVVHQATGMVMVQLGTDGTSAFAALRARAFQEGRTLQDVAHDVLQRRTRLDGEEV